MIEILNGILTRFDSIGATIKQLLFVLRSDYVIEQTMLAELNLQWSRWMTRVAFVGLPVVVIFIVIELFRNKYHMLRASCLMLWLGGVALVVGGILAMSLHAIASHQMIHAATPILQMTKELMPLVF